MVVRSGLRLMGVLINHNKARIRIGIERDLSTLATGGGTGSRGCVLGLGQERVTCGKMLDEMRTGDKESSCLGGAVEISQPAE